MNAEHAGLGAWPDSGTGGERLSGGVEAALADRDGPGGLAGGIKGYTAWRKALWGDKGLRDLYADNGRTRWDPRATAEAMALYGANGRGCWAGSETIADVLGCTRRTVERHRRELVNLGWFAVVGKHRRANVYNIALPSAEVEHPADLTSVSDTGWCLDDIFGRVNDT